MSSFAPLVGFVTLQMITASPAPPAAPSSPTNAEDEDDGHVHHAHEADPQLHGGEERRVVVEAPTDAPDRPITSTSDLELEVGELARVPRANAEDLLTFSPGVAMTNAGGEGHPSTIYVRGFDAGEGEDLEVSVEGVPINEVANPHNHGYADTGFLLPELVTHVRVTQGSFDPGQGDFATAGSAGYSLGMRERGVHLHGGYGRFDEWQGTALWGPGGQESGTYLGIGAKGGDGFGTNRAFLSGRLLGGYARSFGDHVHLRLFAAGHLGRWQQAGALRLDDYAARRLPCGPARDMQFFCTYDENQGGEVSRALVGARVFHDDGPRRYSHAIFAGGRRMEVRENFTGYTQVLDHPDGPRGDGIEQAYRVFMVGARGFTGLRARWRDREQIVDLGYHLRYDHGRAGLERLTTATGQPYATLFAHDFEIVNPAIYLRGGFTPARWFELRGGVRVDVWIQSVWRAELAPNGAPTHVLGYAVAPQPRASMTFLPRNWLRWIVSYGMGSRSTDANGLANADPGAISRTQGAEAGVELLWEELPGHVGVDLRFVGFYTHVDRDQAFDEVEGRNLPIGASHHFGLMSSLGLDLRNWLVLRASATWARAHEVDASAGPFAWGRGDSLPGIPRLTIRGDASTWHGFTVGSEHFTWSLAAGVGHIGRRPLPYDRMGTSFTLVDAHAGARWRWVELGVEIENLLDARYREVEMMYPSNFADPAAEAPQMPMLHFAAGAPLTVMGTLSLHFEPGEAEHFRRDRAARAPSQESRP